MEEEAVREREQENVEKIKKFIEKNYTRDRHGGRICNFENLNLTLIRIIHTVQYSSPCKVSRARNSSLISVNYKTLIYFLFPHPTQKKKKTMHVGARPEFGQSRVGGKLPIHQQNVSKSTPIPRILARNGSLESRKKKEKKDFQDEQAWGENSLVFVCS